MRLSALRKVAIVGSAITTRDLAPADWETWGLAWWPDVCKRQDRLFELHDPRHCAKFDAKYESLLKRVPNLWTWRRVAKKYNATPFPLGRVNALRGDYFTSSVSYMVALAILEEVDEIGVWGVDLVEDEYQHQRPCLESWLGFAEGRGIKITLPEQSALFKSPYKYGREKPVTTLLDTGCADEIWTASMDRMQTVCEQGAVERPSDTQFFNGAHWAFEQSKGIMKSHEQGCDITRVGALID